MKNKSIYFLLVVIAGFICSCGVTKTQELVSESSDKLGQIKIYGRRDTSFDPFKTSIIINGYGQSDTLITEIFAKDMTKENVLFSWDDNNNCIVTFLQQDDSKRIMEIAFGKAGNSLREAK